MTQLSPELVSEKENKTTARTSSVRSVLKQCLGGYKFIAIFSMNTLIALIVTNIACHLINQYCEKKENQEKENQALTLFTEKYHDYTVPQMKEIQKERRLKHQYEFAPYIGYKFRPEWRQYLHITPAGFRCSTNNGPWPPSPNNLNVFVYGASTTFGPGLTDDETIPAQLQEFLKGKGSKPVMVYNFGTSGFNSTTERVQFSNMLAQGLRPDIAIFIDGNVDTQFAIDDPPLSNEMREMMKDRGYGLLKASQPFFNDLPMTKFINRVREAGRNRKSGQFTKARFNQEQLNHIITRYMANKNLIEVQARAFGIKTLFVWQPCSSYKFNRAYHPFAEDFSHGDMVPSYELMAQTVKKSPPQFTKNFLWLADIQEGINEPCYVDDNHYRANLCKLIGNRIGETLLDRKFLTKEVTPPVGSPKG